MFEGLDFSSVIEKMCCFRNFYERLRPLTSKTERDFLRYFLPMFIIWKENHPLKAVRFVYDNLPVDNVRTSVSGKMMAQMTILNLIFCDKIAVECD